MCSISKYISILRYYEEGYVEIYTYKDIGSLINYITSGVFSSGLVSFFSSSCAF